MPFGFNKPSRSYANSRTSNYDAYTGYPTGRDDAYGYSNGGQQNGGYDDYRDGNGYADDGRVRKQDYAAGPSRASVIADAQPLKRKTTTKKTNSELGEGPNRSSKPRVSFESPQISPLPTPSAVDYFKPRKGGSVLGVGVQRNGSVAGSATGTGRARKSRSVQMGTFSAVDLAPPPPKAKVVPVATPVPSEVSSKGKGKAVVAEVEEEEDEDVEEETHPHMHVDGAIDEDVGELAKKYIDVDGLRDGSYSHLGDVAGSGSKGRGVAGSVGRSNEGSGSLGGDEDSVVSARAPGKTEKAASGSVVGAATKQSVVSAARTITPELAVPSRTSPVQQGSPRSPQPGRTLGERSAESSRSVSPAPSSRSQSRSHISSTSTSAAASNERKSSGQASYDLHSPWNPEPAPVPAYNSANGLAGLNLGAVIGSGNGRGPGPSTLSRAGSVMTQKSMDRQTLRSQSTATEWGTTTAQKPPLSPARTESNSSGSSLGPQNKQKKKARPISGVSRSYSALAPAILEPEVTEEYDRGRPQRERMDSTHSARSLGTSGASVLEEPRTPDLQDQQGFSLAPPMVAVQPPTPLRDELASNPLSARGEHFQFEDAPEDGDSVRDVEVPAVKAEEAKPVMKVEEPVGRLPVEPFREFKAAASASASSSNKSSPSLQGSFNLPLLPPPPTDPSQPAVLRWDPTAQRWVSGDITPPLLVPGANGHRRTESVVSSASAYSQVSTPAQHIPLAQNGRRQSLPAIKTTPPKGLRRGLSPMPSPLSRPTSPSNSRPSSIYGNNTDNGYSSPLPGNLPNRRMSIEPAYQLSPTTLTLLPEMRETEYPAQRGSIDVPRSRPASRASSIRSERVMPHTERFRPASAAANTQKWRNSVAFPGNYDINQRLSAFGTSSRGSSDNGEEDYIDDGESRYHTALPKTRAMSMNSASHYSGSMYENAPNDGSVGMWRKQEKVGQESALESISVRGDPVPLLGADGAGQEGRGGYSSMILPTGSYTPVADPTKNVNKLDARVLGMPNTTMSTITLSPSNGNLSRRSSLTGVFHSHARSPTPVHLLADLPPPVAFSAHQAPPSKISPSQVLVQVYAVALDRFDFDMVREKSDSGSGAGKWVPGRSFVGRALDVGADVRVILKGDMVMGLVDIKKSGTLAEFIVVDRRRIARSPVNSHLSLEQQACLPLLGVTAHRACVGLGRGARALILNAHEGVGSLVCQELSQNGIHVTAQVPPYVESGEDDAWDNGASEVVVDEPVIMLNGQHESGFEFVLDTQGGRKIYDAARRVLRTNGTYVTLVGDDAEHLTSGPQMKASLHALRRAFIKKDKKAISYIHLMPGGGDIDVSGQDSRDILELPVMALYRPKVGMVVPFERAPDAFEELAVMVTGRAREESGSVVVRLMN